MRSNSDRLDDAAHAYALGANSFETKPMGMEMLGVRLRAAFEFWHPCRAPHCEPEGTTISERLSSDARAMAASHEKILRVLRTAFSSEELQILQGDAAFMQQLDAAASMTKHVPNDLMALCRLGGAILAQPTRSLG